MTTNGMKYDIGICHVTSYTTSSWQHVDIVWHWSAPIESSHEVKQNHMTNEIGHRLQNPTRCHVDVMWHDLWWRWASQKSYMMSCWCHMTWLIMWVCVPYVRYASWNSGGDPLMSDMMSCWLRMRWLMMLGYSQTTIGPESNRKPKEIY